MPGRRVRPVRRCRHGRPTYPGPWTRHARRVAYENPWITVWHDEVTRPDGSPGIYGVVHFANLAAGVVALDDDDRVAARRPAPLHARRVLVGDPRGRRPGRRDAPRRCPARAASRRPASSAAEWRELGRVRALELGLGRARRPVPGDGLTRGEATPGRDRGARDPLGAVRRGAGDDPRRPDHRRDERRRRSSASPWPGAELERTDRAVTAPTAATGTPSSSASAPWAPAPRTGLEPVAGHARPRPRAVRPRPCQRRVGRPQPDHPAVLPPARLRPAGQAGLRDLGGGRGGGRRRDRDRHAAGSTCGQPIRPSRSPTTPTASPPRTCRSSGSMRRRCMRRWPQWRLADDVDRACARRRAGSPTRSRATPRTAGSPREQGATLLETTPVTAIRDAGGGGLEVDAGDGTYRTGAGHRSTADAWTNEPARRASTAACR